MESLSRRLGVDLSPAPGFFTPRAEVTAVHISELLDPSPYLSGGELLLTTGLSLPTNRIGLEKYVGRLRRAGLAALAIGLGPVHREPPAALVAACLKHGLTLLVVPAPTPFLTITKAYWSEVSRTAEQQLKDVLVTQRTLVDAAASADPVIAVLRTLARAVEGWAATFTPQGEVKEVYPPGLLDEAEALRPELARLTGVHSAASFSSPAGVQLAYPMAVDDRVGGFLAVGTQDPLDSERRRPVMTAVALLSIDAVRRAGSQSAAFEGRRCVALLVATGHAGAARSLAAELGEPAPPDRVRVLAWRGEDIEGTCTRLQQRTTTFAVPTGRNSAWFLLGSDVTSAELEAAATATDTTDPAAVAYLSHIVPLEQVPAVLAQAKCRIASLEPGTRSFDDPQPFDPGLATMLDVALPKLSQAQLAGLVGYLRHRGQWEAASRALGIHRNTLRHRLQRCRDLLAVDVDDPDVASELWLSLRRRGMA